MAGEGGRHAGGEAIFRRAWPLLLLGAGLLIWFGPWLIASEPRMGGDVTMEHYPRLTYALAELRTGRLPLWAPLTMAGVPMLANPQLALFYPPNWLLLLALPVGAALNYSAALHVGLAAMATYLLARRLGIAPAGALLAATSYGFNGLFAARLWAGNVSIAQMAGWLPVMLMAADLLCRHLRWRSLVLLTGALTLSLLVGSYQPWFLGLLAVAAYLEWMPGAWRVRLLRLVGLGLAGMLSVALAAPQLVPAYELAQWSVRAGRLDWEFATAASLPPWHLPALALPELFGSGAGTYWPGPWWHWHELTFYGGVLPLVLLPLGLARPREPWVRYCAGLALVALVLALGRYTPVYGWLYDWIPGYGSFRDPARHLVLGSLAVALLAGRGAERLLAGRARLGTLAALGVVLVVGAGVSLAAAAAAGTMASAVVPFLEARGLWTPPTGGPLLSPSAAGETILLLVARATAMAVLAAALGLIAIVLARRLSPRPAAVLLAAALFADLTFFGWRHLHTPLPLAPGIVFADPASQFAEYLGAETLRQVESREGPWRVAPLGREAVVAGNAGYLLGVPLAVGLDPLLPRRYAELVALINGGSLASFENLVIFLEATPSPLWALLNARHRLVPGAGDSGQRGSRYAAQEDAAALPRALAVGDVRLVASGREGLAALAEPGFDPNAMAMLEAPAGVGAAPVQGGAVLGADAESRSTPPRAGIASYAAGEILVAADLPAGGAVVVLEAWHPGWTATLDGVPTAVYPVDHAFLGVLAPAGPHEVRLRFAPRSLPLGLGIAGAVAVSGGLVAAVMGVRRVWGRAGSRGGRGAGGGRGAR